jgi:putative endonuclease
LRRLLLRFPRLFVRLFEPDDRELGELGEEVAARHLRRLGWRILARRLRTRNGEADLVARREGVVAIVEVKTARSHPIPRPRGVALPESVLLRWRPGARCDARRLRRLRTVGQGIAPGRVRVDLIEVWLAEPGRKFRILHHADLQEPVP